MQKLVLFIFLALGITCGTAQAQRINRNQVQLGTCPSCAAAANGGTLATPTITNGVATGTDISGTTTTQGTANAHTQTLRQIQAQHYTLEAFGGLANSPSTDNSVAMAHLVSDLRPSVNNPIRVYGDCSNLYYSNAPFIIPDGVTFDAGCGHVSQYSYNKSYAQTYSVGKIWWYNNSQVSGASAAGPNVGDTLSIGSTASTLATPSTECTGTNGSPTTITFVPHSVSVSITGSGQSSASSSFTISGTNYVKNGATVTGTKIANGTTIASITGSTIVLSQNTTSLLANGDSIIVTYTNASNEAYVETTPQAEAVTLENVLAKSADTSINQINYNVNYIPNTSLTNTSAYSRLMLEFTFKVAGSSGDSFKIGYNSGAATYTSMSTYGWGSITAASNISCLQGGRNALQGGGLAVKVPIQQLTTSAIQPYVVSITTSALQASPTASIAIGSSNGLQLGGTISGPTLPDGDFVNSIVDATHITLAYPPASSLVSGSILLYAGAVKATVTATQGGVGNSLTVNDATNIPIGQAVSGTNIAPGSTVLGTTPTSITLSQNTTAAVTSGTIITAQAPNLTILPVASTSAYSIGELVNSDTATTLTGAQTLATDTLVGSTTNLVANMTITGPGLPDHDYVVNIVDATHFNIAYPPSAPLASGVVLYQPRVVSANNYLHGTCQIVAINVNSVQLDCIPTAPLPSGATFAVQPVAVKLGQSSAFLNGYIVQAGLQSPPADYGTYRQNINDYKGLGVGEIDPISGTSSDFRIDNAMLLGFSEALYVSNNNRVRLKDLYFDDDNAIELAGMTDISAIDYLRGQNYYSGNYAGTGKWLGLVSYMQRPGYFLSIHDGQSGSLLNNIIYSGYDQGINLYNEYYNTINGVRAGSDLSNLETPRLLFAMVTNNGLAYGNVACSLSQSKGEKYTIQQNNGMLLSIAFLSDGLWQGTETVPTVYCNDSAPISAKASATQTSNTSLTLTVTPQVGQLVSGTNIAANTLVTAVSGNTATLSVATTSLLATNAAVQLQGNGAAVTLYKIYNNAVDFSGIGSRNSITGVTNGNTVGVADSQVADNSFLNLRVNGAQNQTVNGICTDYYIAAGTNTSINSGMAGSPCTNSSTAADIIVAANAGNVVLSPGLIIGTGGINVDPTSVDTVFNYGAACIAANCNFNAFGNRFAGPTGVEAFANNTSGQYNGYITHVLTASTVATTTTRLTEDGKTVSGTNSLCFLKTSYGILKVGYIDITGKDLTNPNNWASFIFPMPGGLLWQGASATNTVFYGGVSGQGPSFGLGTGLNATFTIGADATLGNGCLAISVTPPNSDNWVWSSAAIATEG